tara:strand:- start:45 stop:998 length:954 start_codon:yes stop_codon:yes gene_type:complete
MANMTVVEARAKAKELKEQILGGVMPELPNKSLTFGQFSEKYMEYVKPRKRSWKNDETMLDKRLRPLFGETLLKDLKRQAIQQMHTDLLEQGFSPATCDHHVKLMRHMLNLAIQWEMIDTNVCEKIPLYNKDNQVENIMTEEQQQHLLATLDSHPNRIPCLLFKFLLNTGARYREALNAKWSDIDLENRTWVIPATNSKSKRINSVPLNSAAIEVLAAMEAYPKHEHIWINQRTQKKYDNINKTWNRIREKIGNPELRLHDLRHQFASNLVNNGRSLYECQKLLGHSDPKVTTRYAHLSTKSLQEASESASVKIRNI